MVQYHLGCTPNQQWRVTLESDGYYSLTPLCDTSKRLDVTNGNAANGTNIQVAANNGTAAQRFRIAAVGGNFYKIQSKLDTNKVVEVVSAGTADSANVQLYDYVGQSQQQWFFEGKVVLNTPLIGQQGDTWCWAAAALMSAKTYKPDINISQYELVTEIQGLENDTGGTVNDVRRAANFASGFTDYQGVVGTLTQEALMDKLRHGHPVIIGGDWKNSSNVSLGGHARVVYGFRFNGGAPVFLIRDPGPVAKGSTITRTYAQIVDGRPSGVDSWVWNRYVMR